MNPKVKRAFMAYLKILNECKCVRKYLKYYDINRIKFAAKLKEEIYICKV